MKKIILQFLLSLSLFAAEFSNKLPLESKQLIDSFECFNKDDKTMIYSYLLALKYRMDNVENKEALVKSDLDYWRLWHIVSDLESNCGLNYRFDDILEETITPTQEDKKTLKKLRRVESSIRTDGTSESSAKMSKYDKKLRTKILANPPKYQVLPKNEFLNDYDLTPLKKYTTNSIPENIFNQIEEQNLTGIKKDVLLRYAVLTEGLIRNYDQPETRHTIKQEGLYLNQCIKYYDLKFRHNFYYNFTRNLASRSITHDSIRRLKTEFLPKEVSAYCENNISSVQVTTFKPRVDKAIKKEKVKVSVKLENLKKYLAKYNVDTEKKKYADQYFKLMKSELEKDSTPTPSLESLKLLRLKQCLVGKDDKEDLILIMSRVKDFRIEDIKERFYANIFNSQRWWKTTIYLKIRSEGETEQLKNFFDCNASILSISQVASKKRVTKVAPQKRINYDGIIYQKDEILKYYAATFVNTPTPDINNKKAIEAGIIPSKWIETNNTIKTIGVPLVIEGMLKGGIKLTYNGIPKGRACERLTTLNIFPQIFFNNETYEGLDYLLIDGKKVKYHHFNGARAKRLCDAQDMHTISFVREETVLERKYRPKPIDCSSDRYKKVSTIDTYRYDPYGFTSSKNNHIFAVSGTKSVLYDASIATKITDLPQMFDYASYLAMNKDGSRIAVPQGRGFSYWDTVNNKMITRLKNDHALYEPFNVRKLEFFNDQEVLAAVAQNGQTVRVLDPINKRLITEITPNFFNDEKSVRYRKPYITTLHISPEGKWLYIGGNRQKIEIWEISKGFLGLGKIKLTYKSTIKLPLHPEVGAIKFDTANPDHLYIATRGKHLHLYDLSDKKIIKTYVADKYMDPKGIQFSDEGGFIMVTGQALYIWERGETVQWDSFSGDGIVGGVFKPKSNQIITVGRTVDHWKLK